jgi:site-specific recombinase XerD
MEEHLRHMRRRNLRPSTIRQRRYVLQRLTAHIAPLRLDQVDLDALRAYIDERALVLGDVSRATEISHLSAFYRWCTLEGVVGVNPMLRLERPRVPLGRPRPIPDAALTVALEQAPAHRIRPWLYLAAYAGLRACDIAGLETENVGLHAEPAIMWLVTKGGGMRSVAISVFLHDVLTESGLPADGWLFPRLDGNPGHVPAVVVSQVCNRYLHELGIAHTLHSLRHWFGTQVYRATHDIRLTQELLGHRNLATVMGYTAVDPTDAVRAVNLLPRV